MKFGAIITNEKHRKESIALLAFSQLTYLFVRNKGDSFAMRKAIGISQFL